LCASCNMLVGQVEKNVTLSKLAMEYLNDARTEDR
jgi:hypothetical protein